MPDPFIRIDGISRRFDMPGGFGKPPMSMRAVDGVSADINRGEAVGVVGESGCGKSTLARLVLRLIEPTEGRILFDGIDLTALSAAELRAARRQMAMVFQDPYSSLDPRYRLTDVLNEPYRAQKLAAPDGRAEELLQSVGLSPRLASAYPHQLSGGQRQRIGIARALALSPALMVLDEPTASLDVSIQAQIIDLLLKLRAEQSLTYLFISHDLGLVSYFCDRVLVMYFGRLVEVLPTATSTPRHPYTRALHDSSFVPDPAARRTIAPIAGEPPSVYAPQPGCAFAARCPRQSPTCLAEKPQLAAAADGSAVACHHPFD